MNNFIGVDNGVSGSIGIITPDSVQYLHTPVIKHLDYTKTKKWIHRVNFKETKNILSIYSPTETTVLVERPMVNPIRFKATTSALRALEAILIILEELGLSYSYIDSKEWQKALLPKKLKGEELKEASLQIGKRTFPQIDFKGFKDADGLLLAYYGKKQVLQRV